jgi:hypothetical protein
VNATRIAALAFLAFAMALGAGAWTLPEGAGALPGPAFFPLGIAAGMAALSVALMFWPGPAVESAAAPGGTRQAAGVVGLLLAYLLLWGTGLFAVRTAVFLCLMLRWTGQGWKASVGASAGLTALVVLAFQVGLKVSLE